MVFAVWMFAILGIGLYAVRRAAAGIPPACPGRPARPVDLDSLTGANIRRPVLALTVGLAGFGAIILVTWPLGLLAHALQNTVDWPTFRWFQARQIPGWSKLWHVLTNIGMPRLTQVICGLGGIFFGIVWSRTGRRWWAPPAVFACAYALEKYTQMLLQSVVHRGHPPTTLGTYPSGGCARVIIVYGLVVAALLLWRWPGNRRAWAYGATVVAILWAVQAYARTYNLEHWVTDVAGGTIFGLMALVVMSVCLLILSEPLTREHRSTPEQQAASRASA